MAKKIIWSPAAETDLKSALNYLNKKWSVLVANQFINKVDSFVNLIAEEQNYSQSLIKRIMCENVFLQNIIPFTIEKTRTPFTSLECLILGRTQRS